MICFRIVPTSSSKLNIVVGRLLKVTIKIGTSSVSDISDAHPTGGYVCCVKLIIAVCSPSHQTPNNLISQLNLGT
jgi:hypothetical protein